MKKNKLKNIIRKFIIGLLIGFSLTISIFKVSNASIGNGNFEPYTIKQESIHYKDKEEAKEYKGRVWLDMAHHDSKLDKGCTYKEYNERDIANNITLKVKKILEENGIEVLLVKQPEEVMSISERIEKANNFKCDYYISIHINSCEIDGKGTGIEAYSFNAWSLSNRVLKELSGDLDLKNRGIYLSEYYNRKIDHSAILEIGFLNNDIDREKLLNQQDTYAEAIADGIIQQLEIDYSK